MAVHSVVDMGNDVPAICQHPECDTVVHRGIVHICGMDPAGAGTGCGLHFCGFHLAGPEQTCERCAAGEPPYEPKPAPDFPEWRMTGQGWEEWRKNNPGLVHRTYGAQMAARAKAQEVAATPSADPAATPSADPAGTTPPAPSSTPPAAPESPPAVDTAPGKPEKPNKPGSAKP